LRINSSNIPGKNAPSSAGVVNHLEQTEKGTTTPRASMREKRMNNENKTGMKRGS
jgi:hypothetical protein